MDAPPPVVQLTETRSGERRFRGSRDDRAAVSKCASRPLPGSLGGGRVKGDEYAKRSRSSSIATSSARGRLVARFNQFERT
jgi:hypothetical protein